MQDSVQILLLIAFPCKVRSRLIVSILGTHTWLKLSCALQSPFLSLPGQLLVQGMKVPRPTLATAAL